MAYAFTNLMNLAGKQQDESTAPIPKSVAPASGGGGSVSSGGAGQLQQAPMNQGTAVAKQFDAAKPIVQRQVAASQGNLRTLGSQGAQQVGQQEAKYRADNKFDGSKYSAPNVENYVNTGTGDLAGMQKVLGGVGFEPKAFDANPEAAGRFGGILAGGGGQYLTQNLGGGTGALERIAGATSGGEVGQTAVDEATKLGGIAGARETTATKEVGAEVGAGVKKAKEDIRAALAASRASLLGDNEEQTAQEQKAYTDAGQAEKTALIEKALAESEPQLKGMFGETGKGRDPYEAAIRGVMAQSLKAASGAPTMRSGKDVITAEENARLGRIGALTGDATPGITEAANYGGQYTLDPAFMENLKKLLPTTPGPLAPGNTGAPQLPSGGMFEGASPMQAGGPALSPGHSDAPAAQAPGAMGLPSPGAAPTPANPYVSALTGGWDNASDPMSVFSGGLSSLWK